MKARNAGQERVADLVSVASRACVAAGRLLPVGHDQTRSAVRDKSQFDQVTDHDLQVEDFLTTTLRAEVPGSAVIGEERVAVPGELVSWYVDPIDGTNNFVRGLPLACVSVGVCVRGELVGGCVYDPYRRECFTGGTGLELRINDRVVPRLRQAAWFPLVLTDLPRPGGLDPDFKQQLAFSEDLLVRSDVRRIGASALALAWVAAGRADVACNLRIKPWDVAAGAALVRAAGGRFVPVGPRQGGYDTQSLAHDGFVGFLNPAPITDWIESRLTEVGFAAGRTEDGRPPRVDR